jgi:hypothetical protein
MSTTHRGKPGGKPPRQRKEKADQRSKKADQQQSPKLDQREAKDQTGATMASTEASTIGIPVELTAAASLLEASGIEIELAPFDPGGVRGFLGQPAPGRILVSPADAERARVLLSEAESGGYAEELENLPEVEAPPEQPENLQDIETGVRSLQRRRDVVVLTRFLGVIALLTAVALARRWPGFLALAFLVPVVSIGGQASLYFARCPRCHLRLRGLWTRSRLLPDVCASCGLKLQ